MSNDVIKYAFIAGELSPTLFGRTDLTKFDLGMAEARNFFVDYRGGLSSRPGFRFCAHIKDDQNGTRLIPFSFSPDEEDTYIVLMGNNYIRFLQGGQYVLSGSTAITGITRASPGVVTAVGHGLVAGQWVMLSGIVGMTALNGRTFEVRSPTANTFQLYSVPDGQPFDTSALSAWTSGGIVEWVYEITSPFNSNDLAGLAFDQYRDRLHITSNDFPPYNLVRNNHDDWNLSIANIAPYYEGPAISAHSTSVAGAAQTLFAVTKVLADGTESTVGPVYRANGLVNYPVTEGTVSVRWDSAPDAAYYRVYRSIVSINDDVSFGSELGYVGRTSGTKFTDPNIIANFARTPPLAYNPFEPGAIEFVLVTGGGAGYNASTSVSIAGGGGTGFVGTVIVDENTGKVVNIVVKSGGSGYVNPVVTITGSGVGATATADARPLVGTYPALSGIFQQRQVYAASLDRPITIWGSQPKRFTNFDSSDFVLDSDAYEFDLDTEAISPIRHLFSTRGGLLAMTQKNVWLLTGGSNGQAVTPTNVLADPQTYTGVSTLLPLRIGADILYTEGKGYAVRMLSYNEMSRVYSGVDRSILSNHLFGPGREITRWGNQESPFKTVWAVRSDGALIAFTIVTEEDVYAWTPCDTRGAFTDLLVVQEGAQDIVYVTTNRRLNGRWGSFIERMDLRQFVNVEDAWCVDCGLALEGTYPAGFLSIFRDEDDNYTIRLTDGGTFTGREGDVIRAGNGIFRIDTVVEPTLAAVTMWAEPTNWVPQTDRALTLDIYSGSWTLDTPTDTLSGLEHLEGEEVAILGDGNVFPRQTVVNGTVTLSAPVTRAIVGLPFECRAKTLPINVPDAAIEGKRKRVVGIGVRLSRSRGLQIGDSYDTTYEMPERTTEDWGRPTMLQDGIHHQSIGTTWDEEGQTYYKLSDPLPVTLLSMISDMEVGDESD